MQTLLIKLKSACNEITNVTEFRSLKDEHFLAEFLTFLKIIKLIFCFLINHSVTIETNHEALNFLL